MTEFSKKIMHDANGGGGMFPKDQGTPTEHLTPDGKKKSRKKVKKGGTQVRQFEQTVNLDTNLTVAPTKTEKKEPAEIKYWWEEKD